MKKVLKCCVYFIVILMVFTSCSNGNGSELSTIEKYEKITEMNEELLSKCQKMKSDIISVIEKIYKDDDFLVYGTTAEEAIEAFKKYYNEAVELLETKKDFDDYIIMFEYGGGTAGEIAYVMSEYNSLTSLFEELTDIYNKLIEITDYEIANADSNDDYETEDEAITTQISNLFGKYVPTSELDEKICDKVFDNNVIDCVYIAKLSTAYSTVDIVNIQ